jgi:hypothetical protein
VFHLLYCNAWHGCGLVGTNSEFGLVGLRRQMHACLNSAVVSAVVCSTDGAPFLAQRVGGCCVEDVKHFLLECPAYQHVRARYPCVFGDAMPDGTTQSEQLRLLAIFDCDQQDQLAHVVYTMIVFREHCLSLPHGSHDSDHQCPANCGGGCGVDYRIQ